MSKPLSKKAIEEKKGLSKKEAEAYEAIASAGAEGIPASELGKKLELGSSSIYQRVAKLKEVELVLVEKAGREAKYKAA